MTLFESVKEMFVINLLENTGLYYKTTFERGCTSSKISLVWSMVFHATFNNRCISAISWWSVLLVEENGVSGENHLLTVNH